MVPISQVRYGLRNQNSSSVNRIITFILSYHIRYTKENPQKKVTAIFLHKNINIQGQTWSFLSGVTQKIWKNVSSQVVFLETSLDTSQEPDNLRA